MPSPGSFVISLDFELYWGVRDKRTIDEVRDNVLGARVAVPRMLALFEEFGIHATWATVGFLFFDRRDDLLANLPRSLPGYRDESLRPYPHLALVGPDEAADPIHFARSLLEQIRRVPNQEIGTHTFSHYYCMEAGQDLATFRADLEAAVSAARRIGVELTSLVFPRNQVAPEYLGVCAELGITAYRGTERSWIHRPSAKADLSLARRAVRLADSYVNLSGHQGYAVEPSPDPRLVNVRGSQFLRPYHRWLRALEPLKRRRLTAAMTDAARRGRVYHLWWHPENFGRNLDRNIDLLRAVLEHYAALADQYGMRSLTMREQCALLSSGAAAARPGSPGAGAASARATGS